MAGVFAPRRAPWARAAAAIAVASTAVYFAWAAARPWSPGAAGGLLFGAAATAIFFLDALYPLRRRLMAWPLATAKNWLQFHLYGGAMACLFVGLHVGFRAPRGAMGWWLVALTAWAAASGLAGVWLQKHIPAKLAAELSVEAIYERIPDLAGRLQQEADDLLAGAPEILQRFYTTSVRADLGRLAPSWSHLGPFQAELARRVAPLEGLTVFLAAEDRIRLESLRTIVTEKLELEVQYSLQRILRQWVVFHVVPAMVLLALLVVHIAAVIAF